MVFFSVLLRFSLSAIKRHELGQNGYHFSGILCGLFSNRFDLAGICFDLIHDAFTVAPLNHRGDAGAVLMWYLWRASLAFSAVKSDLFPVGRRRSRPQSMLGQPSSPARALLFRDTHHLEYT